MQKQTNLNIDFLLFTYINPKWITGLNVKCKTIKLLKDNKGKNLDDLGYGDAFLNITPIKEKNFKEINKYNTKDMIHERNN